MFLFHTLPHMALLTCLFDDDPGPPGFQQSSLHRSHRKRMRTSKICGITREITKHMGNIWEYIELYGNIWKYLGNIWEISGNIWKYMGLSENVGLIFPMKKPFFIGIMISKTIGYNGLHNIFRQTHI